MDFYRCENCQVVFDEFEMDYRAIQQDKRTLCGCCRKYGLGLNRTEVEEWKKILVYHNEFSHGGSPC